MYMPEIPAFRRGSQKNCKVEASLGYPVSLRLACV